MPSSKDQMVRDQMFGGMNRGVRDHLIDSSKQWRTSFGMRHFETQVRQPARRKEMFSVLSSHTYPVSLLVNLPTGYENFGTLLGLTDSGVFRLTSTSAIRLGQPDGSSKVLNADGIIRRFGHTVYNKRLFFVNPLNRVHTTDGTNVRLVENSPMAHYVEVFFDHIVVGRPVDFVSRIQWSGLYNFVEWTPATHTEADHFDCAEHQGEEDYTGVTGVRRLGPLLCTYTTSAIYISRYVGLPRVMVTDAVVQDYGNGLPWTLVVVDRSHYFVDMREMSFFRFDGGEVTEIGRAIKSYFFADLTTDLSYRLRTYGYVDSVYHEIHWVYPSVASVAGEMDREVVFNYKTGTWWAGPVEHVWSFCRGTRRSRTIDDLTGTIDGLSGTIDGLGETNDAIGRIYGSRNGRLLRDEISADTTASLLEQPATPHLETGDLYYGDVENHKECESMVIHSKLDDSAGIDVFAATRTNIDDAVNLVQQSQVWLPTLVEQRLSMPRVSGRIFRYKFVPKAVTTTTVTETRTRGTPGFTLLSQIPAIVEPPPPAATLLFRYTNGISTPNYSFPVTVPVGADQGMFVWLHVRKAAGGSWTINPVIDSIGATTLFSATSDDNVMAVYLFYVVGNATGVVTVSIDIVGGITVGRVHAVGVCVNNLSQTVPVISQQDSFNVLDNGFSFPASTNHLLLPGLVGYSRSDPVSPVPYPMAFVGSTYAATIFQSFTDPPYISDGICALGHRVGASSAVAGWTMDALADGSMNWWNIAVALRGA